MKKGKRISETWGKQKGFLEGDRELQEGEDMCSFIQDGYGKIMRSKAGKYVVRVF